MQLSEIVSAAPALQKLILQELPLPIAWRLSKLIGLCNPALEFFGVERMKCRDNDDMSRLLAMEIDTPGLDKISIPLRDNITLSAADVKSLEPFVKWEE